MFPCDAPSTKKTVRGGGKEVVKVETENWILRFSQLRIPSCPMSIMAFELPIIEIDFALSEFKFKVFTVEIDFQFTIFTFGNRFFQFELSLLMATLGHRS